MAVNVLKFIDGNIWKRALKIVDLKPQTRTVSRGVTVNASKFLLLQRSVGDASPSVNLSRVKTCRSSTPCGWAVYVPFTRRVDYFMKNT
jgi:hypothetical protein